MSVRIVLMTAPDRKVGEEIGEALVRERLAACANVLPGLLSIYRWEGAVERDQEVLVILKTRAERVKRLVERGAELHPYDVPELLALPVDDGHGPYLEWVLRESSGEG